MCDFLDEGMDWSLEFLEEFEPFIIVLIENGLDLSF